MRKMGGNGDLALARLSEIALPAWDSFDQRVGVIDQVKCINVSDADIKASVFGNPVTNFDHSIVRLHFEGWIESADRHGPNCAGLIDIYGHVREASQVFENASPV